MRRITLWLLSTISALVLLFSYSTSTGARAGTSIAAPANGDQSATGDSGAAPATGSTTAGADSAATPTPTPSASSQAAGVTGSSTTGSSAKNYVGTAINTRYGPVQVQITVANGKITKSIVLQVPWTDHKDQEINGYAVPLLNSQAVANQSATIDMVSGATYTSDAYIQSLQSAIDQAHL